MTTFSNKLVLALAIGMALAISAPAFSQQAAPTPSTQTTGDDAIPTDDASAEEPAESSDAGTMPMADKPMMHDATAANPAPADPSLLPVFKDFGELPGLTSLMDDFMAQMLVDPRTRPFFEQADQASIKKHLVEQFCVILGGPCNYTGRDMKVVHAQLGINRGDFNALVEDLQIAMTKHHIPFHSQNKLLAKLAPMHREVETK